MHKIAIVRNNIFLIDAAGGAMSAIMLGLVLPVFKIGLAEKILMILSAVALGYAIFSLNCMMRKLNGSSIHLKIICFANLTYCFATAAVLVKFYNQLTAFGVAYFVIEILIILMICMIEYSIAKSIAKKDFVS